MTERNLLQSIHSMRRRQGARRCRPRRRPRLFIGCKMVWRVASLGPVVHPSINRRKSGSLARYPSSQSRLRATSIRWRCAVLIDSNRLLPIGYSLETIKGFCFRYDCGYSPASGIDKLNKVNKNIAIRYDTIYLRALKC